MPVRRFTYTTADDAGFAGWKIDGMPMFEAASALGVAHDSLEHFNSCQTYAAEFMAFGAMLHIRGVGDYWEMTLHPTPLYSLVICSEVADLLAKCKLKLPPCKAPALGDEVAARHYEGLHDSVMALIENEWENVNGWKADLRTPTTEEFSAAVDLALAWIRKGYHKAVKRYKDADPNMLATMFNEIEKEVERINKRAEDGDRLTVRFDLDGMNWRVTHKPLYNHDW